MPSRHVRRREPGDPARRKAAAVAFSAEVVRPQRTVDEPPISQERDETVLALVNAEVLSGQLTSLERVERIFDRLVDGRPRAEARRQRETLRFLRNQPARAAATCNGHSTTLAMTSCARQFSANTWRRCRSRPAPPRPHGLLRRAHATDRRARTASTDPVTARAGRRGNGHRRRAAHGRVGDRRAATKETTTGLYA